jgi:uncharacterized protein YndB with AHSA1/START domain
MFDWNASFVNRRPGGVFASASVNRPEWLGWACAMRERRTIIFGHMPTFKRVLRAMAPMSVTMLAAALLVQGCGPRLSLLDELAQTGKINENAPVLAHLEIEINAPPAKVWALLVDAPSWPKWTKQISSVTPDGPLAAGKKFTWKSGDTEIESQVQLLEPQRRLAWTGTAMSAKAIHVWELKDAPGDRTLVKMKESMDGPLMSRLYPQDKLSAAGMEWLLALKRAAEPAAPSAPAPSVAPPARESH